MFEAFTHASLAPVAHHSQVIHPTFLHRAYKMYSVSFSPYNKLLAFRPDYTTIELWDVESRSRIVTLNWNRKDLQTTLFLSLSPDGELLACGADIGIGLWSLETKEMIGILEEHPWANCLAFSPDSKLLVSGSLLKTIKLWDLETKNPVATLGEHKGWMTSVAFSPDGKLIASGFIDANENKGTLMLWDVSAINRETITKKPAVAVQDK